MSIKKNQALDTLHTREYNTYEYTILILYKDNIKMPRRRHQNLRGES